MRNKGEQRKGLRNQQVKLLTKESPFVVQEAYRTLRTNIMFSDTNDGCKKIVVASAIQGETKSTTAVNLALAFVEDNKKVLLIDCDMRLPTIGLKLDIPQDAGLTNVLVGEAHLKDAIQQLPNGLHVLLAGDIPPNPTELLGSRKMEALLEGLGVIYDCIIIDTPPICTVSDAAIVSRYATGVLLTVRQDYSDINHISDALKKFEFANARIMGLVYTDAQVRSNKKYYKSGYYERK